MRVRARVTAGLAIDPELVNTIAAATYALGTPPECHAARLARLEPSMRATRDNDSRSGK